MFLNNDPRIALSGVEPRFRWFVMANETGDVCSDRGRRAPLGVVTDVVDLNSQLGDRSLSILLERVTHTARVHRRIQRSEQFVFIAVVEECVLRGPEDQRVDGKLLEAIAIVDG